MGAEGALGLDRGEFQDAMELVEFAVLEPAGATVDPDSGREFFSGGDVGCFLFVGDKNVDPARLPFLGLEGCPAPAASAARSSGDMAVNGALDEHLGDEAFGIVAVNLVKAFEDLIGRRLYLFGRLFLYRRFFLCGEKNGGQQ